MAAQRLETPDARQGPGPIPRQVLDRLDLIVARRTRGVLPGDRLAAGAFANAVIRVGRVATTPGLVVVVTDFRGQADWIRPLGALSTHHSVMAVEVRDPREGTLPAVGRLAVVDPETGEHLEVDTSRPRLRERFEAIEAER